MFRTLLGCDQSIDEAMSGLIYRSLTVTQMWNFVSVQETDVTMRALTNACTKYMAISYCSKHCQKQDWLVDIRKSAR